MLFQLHNTAMQYYSMGLYSNYHSWLKNEQMLYCDAIYYVRLLWFNKNHKFEINFHYSHTNIQYSTYVYNVLM
jgi:hypothetical protein